MKIVIPSCSLGEREFYCEGPVRNPPMEYQIAETLVRNGECQRIRENSHSTLHGRYNGLVEVHPLSE